MVSIVVMREDDALPPVPDASTRVLIGPANSAGQAGLWADALRRHLVGTDAIGFQYGLRPGAATSDLRVDALLHDHSSEWNRRLRGYVTENFTHVLLESNRPLWHDPEEPAPVETQLRTLREASISTALVAHGSDVKVPSVYRHLHPDTQYEYLDPDFVDLLEGIARDNVRAFADFDGPTFVTSPVLLRFVPSARWLPLTIDVDRWATDRGVFERDVPVVVHSPSSAQKGSVWIDPAMRALADEGLIEYRRLTDIPHDRMPETIQDADILVEQLGAGGYGVAACEAMAAGRVVVGTVTPLVRRHIASTTGLEVPIVRANRESVAEVVRSLVADPTGSRDLGAAGAAYVRALHDGRYAARVLGSWIDPGLGPVAPPATTAAVSAPACSVILAPGPSTACLPETLASVERQTIGSEELQVIVANGSDPVGGLDDATGRYLLVLAAGDVLEEDAVEVLVNHADAWDSDVIFARAGSGGEGEAVPEAIEPDRLRDLDLSASPLPDYLSHPPMYRRELIDRVDVRHRPRLLTPRDRLFAAAAMARAGRVSLIGTTLIRDHERHGRPEPAPPADAAERYDEVRTALATIAELPPGGHRDAVAKAQFDQVILEDLRDSFASRDDAGRAFVCERIRQLADEHLTDAVLRSMPVARRVPLLLAAAGETAAVIDAVEPDRAASAVPIEVDGERAFIGYPGPARTTVDRDAWELLEVDGDPYDRVAETFAAPRVELDGTRVVLVGRLALTGAPVARARLVRVKKTHRLGRISDTPPDRGRPATLELDPAQGVYRLGVETADLPRGHFRVRVAARIAGAWYDVDLTSPDRVVKRIQDPRGERRVRIAADESGHLTLKLWDGPEDSGRRSRRPWTRILGGGRGDLST